ncbi:MAG: L-histidine N(alpha)-methyltransferase [Acidimicrobiales bacterium]
MNDQGRHSSQKTGSVGVDVFLTDEQLHEALEDDVRTGLTGTPKSIPPLWFYDEVGSKLFDEITKLEEYYPTRAERAILADNATEIAELADADTLVELGSGSCEKTRLLLDAMVPRGLRGYVPFDVSEGFMRHAAEGILHEYPGLQIDAVVGDFRRHLDKIPTSGGRLVAFLGGTIGNLVPAERRRFLFDLNCMMGEREHLLLGVDLLKDPKTLVTAYNDQSGVTAAFNRNVLSVINHELDADFVPERFDHIALWNDDEQWIEMRLRSKRQQSVCLSKLGIAVHFDEGEDLLTEISAKFAPSQVENELLAADFVTDATWGADDGQFLVALAHPYC